VPGRSSTGRRASPTASVVVTTLASEADAAKLARAVVKEGLAACGTLVPGARSIYAWKGAIEDSGEVLLVLKTTAPRERALAKRVRALHPYDVPELLVRRVRVANPDYLQWLAGSVRARA